MEIQDFITDLKATKTESEKQRVIDTYLEEVSREEEIIYLIEYHLKNIAENLVHLEDPQELQSLVTLFKERLEERKADYKDRLELST